MFPIHRTNHTSKNDYQTLVEDKECPVCFEKMGSRNVNALACGHDYHKNCINQLKSKGENVGETCPLCRRKIEICKDGQSAIHIAAMSGRIDDIDNLIKSEADVDIRDDKGKTALHYAAENGHESVIKALIQAGAVVNRPAKEKRTALHFAAEKGHKDVIKALIEAGADVNLKAKGMKTALHFAAKKDHRSAITALVTAGADFNAKNSKGKTAVKILGDQTEYSSSVKKGFTLLHWAAVEGHRELTQSLLERGACVDAKTEDGKTALYFAALKGHLGIMTTLLSKGADINVKNSQGYNAIQTFFYSNDIIYITPKLVRLIDAGLDANVACLPDGTTAIAYFVQCNRWDKVSEIIGKADINALCKSKGGYAPIHEAALMGNSGTIEKLTEFGADVKQQTPKGETVLHYAAAEGREELVATLVAKGVDVNHQSQGGETALHYARKRAKNGFESPSDKNRIEETIDQLILEGADLRSDEDDDRARDQAERWLANRKIEILGRTSAYDQVFEDVINLKPRSYTFDNDELRKKQVHRGLAEYWKRVDMVADIPRPGLEELLVKLDEREIPATDPIYQSTLARISSADEQRSEDNLNTTKVESYRKYLPLFKAKRENLSNELVELKSREERERETLEDERDSILPFIKMEISTNKDKTELLDSWIKWMEKELGALSKHS